MGISCMIGSCLFGSAGYDNGWKIFSWHSLLVLPKIIPLILWWDYLLCPNAKIFVLFFLHNTISWFVSSPQLSNCFCKVGDRVRFLSFIHCARSNHSMVVMYRSLVLQRGQKLGPPKISSVIFIPSPLSLLLPDCGEKEVTIVFLQSWYIPIINRIFVICVLGIPSLVLYGHLVFTHI